MPRRKKTVIETTPIVTGNYWDEVLIKLGYKLPYLQPEQIAVQPTAPPEPESNDLKIFIQRVAEKLTVPANIQLTPIEQARVKKVQEEIKRGLIDVLEGRRELGDWFTETRKNFNLKSYELAQILYESLEGLRSREAQELRDHWFQFLVAERKAYGF